jgi:G3E family GTPase
MGIESPVLFDSEGALFTDIYELPGGCLCCSAKSDLLKLVEFFCTSAKANVDCVLVECNGAADIASVDSSDHLLIVGG